MAAKLVQPASALVMLAAVAKEAIAQPAIIVANQTIAANRCRFAK